MNHTHEPPSLLPAPGQERTYALFIAGAPLLLILLFVILAHAGSGSDSASGAGTMDGLGSGYQTYEPSTPDAATAYGTDPSAPTAGDDTTYLSPAPPATDPYATTDPADTLLSTDPADPGSTASADSGSGGPADTVNRYFQAINDHDYQTAWSLGGKNLDTDYDSFVAGFAGTEEDVATVGAVDGDTVSVHLVARQTDGGQKSYSGEYTVIDGVITNASMAAAD